MYVYICFNINIYIYIYIYNNNKYMCINIQGFPLRVLHDI